MSIVDIMKNSKKVNTRKFINTKDILDYGLETYKGGTLVYINVKPINLSVLSSDKIANMVTNLMLVISEIEEIEISCLSSRENFDENKIALEELLEKETNEKVRRIIEKDISFFDRVQIQTASARVFLITLRFSKDREKEIFQTTNRVLKLLNERGFSAKQCQKADLKRMLAVYFVQNVTQVYFEDYNGSRFILEE